MDENKLISLMENFKGQKFQWIKTQKPDLLGKVVTCRNIEPRGDRFFAIFEDGSAIDTTQLNSSLIMIHGDMQPLSKAEVESIAGPRRPAPVPNPASNQQVNPGIVTPQQPHVQTNHQHISQPVQPVAPAANMFDMFSSESSQINLALDVKLPDKKLLKMMYANAEDKDKFLDQLSEYIFREINKQVVKDSISSVVVPPTPIKKEKTTGPTITVKEIHES